jgi:hypothetical protein
MLTIIACDVIKEELLKIAANSPVEFRFVSMGLHRWPERLKEELGRILAEEISPETTAVVFGFGLCGGALAGLRTAGVPLVIPLSHDCIPLLIGSRLEYHEELAREKGTFFLSGGWMEGERTLLSEYRRVLERHGEVKARKVMAAMLDSYHRILFITTGHPRQEQRLAEARELALLLGLSLDVRNNSGLWLEQLINGPWDRERFVVIEPGSKIIEELFAPVSLPKGPLQST